MNRIMVIGCCGSGKSTFSRKLHQILDLPLIHLDQHYWQPEWTETPKEEWKEINKKLAAGDNWIIDGNYGGTMDIRTDRADTIIYLDYPTWKCLYRVVKRIITYHGQSRPDMTEGCNERFDIEFLHYVLTYNFLRRKHLINKVNALRQEKVIHIFRTDQECDNFLEKIKNRRLKKINW